MSHGLPDFMVNYLAERDAQRANAVNAFLAKLTPRERALFHDAAAAVPPTIPHPPGDPMNHTDPTGLALLRDAESYLSALHGSVARHDNLAANFGCAGCELRDQIAEVLWPLTDWDGDQSNAERAADAVFAVLPPPADRAAVLREGAVAVAALDRRKTVIQADTIRDAWEEGRDEGADLLRRMADEAQPTTEQDVCGAEPQFGASDCTCIPFTRQTAPPRYLNRPTDTVDMISGWERRRGCPHHAHTAAKPAAGAEQDGVQQ